MAKLEPTTDAERAFLTQFGQKGGIRAEFARSVLDEVREDTGASASAVLNETGEEHGVPWSIMMKRESHYATGGVANSMDVLMSGLQQNKESGAQPQLAIARLKVNGSMSIEEGASIAERLGLSGWWNARVQRVYNVQGVEMDVDCSFEDGDVSWNSSSQLDALKKQIASDPMGSEGPINFSMNCIPGLINATSGKFTLEVVDFRGGIKVVIRNKN